jgi:phage baseplate assembly protein W
MSSYYKYLGEGIKWPIEINQFGAIELQSEIALVAQSIRRYLETPLGTEFFNEDIGSRINLIGYEPNDELLQVLLEMLINEAVDNEKRCEYINTEFSRLDDDNPEVIQCKIYVRVLKSSEIESFIWPYYNRNN